MAGQLSYQENEFEDDYLDWSDEDNIVCNSRYVISSSSDEEAEKFLKSIKTKRLVKKAPVVDSRDDFEREMDSELSMTLLQLQASFCKKANHQGEGSDSQHVKSTSNGQKDNSKDSSEENKEFYDKIYFDSDDSDNEELSHKPSGSGTGKEKYRIPSNDELFYDPKMDDRDQAWMDRKRRSYQVKNKTRPPGSPKSIKNPESLPESDAVLNCPACLTMLCMDCQRHEIYHTQYRAMFVFNCNINWNEVLKLPNKNQKKEYFRNKKMKKSKEQVIGGTTEVQKKAESSNTKTAEPVKEGNFAMADSSPQIHLSGMELETSGGISGTKENGSLQNKTEGSPKAAELAKEGNAVSACMPLNSTAVSGPKIHISGRELETSKGISGTTENTSLQVNSVSSEELFHPVMCKICNTKVAVYDKDEVYHFFNIVTSH